MHISSIIVAGSYPVIALLLFIDSTSVNFIASGIASTLVINIWIIWLLAIIVEVLADVLYYYLGMILPLEKIEAKVKNKELLLELNNAFVRHPTISLVIIKFLGPLAIPSIMYFGNKKALYIWRFIPIAALVAFCRATTISFLGYYVGKGVAGFSQAYNVFQTMGIVVAVVVLLFIFVKASPKFFQKIFKRLK